LTYVNRSNTAPGGRVDAAVAVTAIIVPAYPSSPPARPTHCVRGPTGLADGSASRHATAGTSRGSSDHRKVLGHAQQANVPPTTTCTTWWSTAPPSALTIGDEPSERDLQVLLDGMRAGTPSRRRT
jgi:hypothetical protein